MPACDSLVLRGDCSRATAISVGAEPGGVPDDAVSMGGGPEALIECSRTRSTVAAGASCRSSSVDGYDPATRIAVPLRFRETERRRAGRGRARVRFPWSRGDPERGRSGARAGGSALSGRSPAPSARPITALALIREAACGGRGRSAARVACQIEPMQCLCLVPNRRGQP